MVFPALIGLTGGIACGKSTAARAISKHAPVIDLDILARETQEPGRSGYRAVVNAFGASVLMASADGGPSANGAFPIDREHLGELVFNDVRARSKLNRAMMLPIIRALVWRILVLWWVRGEARIVLDAPLLFESRLDRFCAATICVDAGGEEVQIERLCQRDRCTREQALAKIRAQLPQAEKVRRATFVLDNSGTPEQTTRAVDALFANKRDRRGGRSLPPSVARRVLFNVFRIAAPVAVLGAVAWRLAVFF